jgi:hypothetical protein
MFSKLFCKVCQSVFEKVFNLVLIKNSFPHLLVIFWTFKQSEIIERNFFFGLSYENNIDKNKVAILNRTFNSDHITL